LSGNFNADAIKQRTLGTQIFIPISTLEFSLFEDKLEMADRDMKGEDKDTKVEDEMIAGDEDGNDEVGLPVRGWPGV
jgi:hypothetical protein